MPFKSKAQQRWMFARHPKMAKKWAAHTPNISKLPEKSPLKTLRAVHKKLSRGKK